MEVAVITAFFKSVLPKLWKVIRDSHDKKADVAARITSIEDELNQVSKRLRQSDLHCRRTSLELSQVIRSAREVALETEYYICRYAYQTRASAGARPRLTYREFAMKIEELKEKLDKIIPDLDRLVRESKASAEEPQDPHFRKEDPVAFGMKVPCQEMKELLDCTPPGSRSKGKLKVISIVGFRGSGKTRLAKKVYEGVGQEFSQRATVSVGNRNLNEVLADLVEKMSNNVGATPTEVLTAVLQKLRFVKANQPAHDGPSATEKVKEFLCKQRYLIVIDDVRRIEDWFTLKEALFADSDAASRIIVTTTSQSIASRCSIPNGHVYKMSTLSDEYSENLFKRALTGDHSVAENQELTTLIKICDGLPLALIESAESLKGKTVDKDACQEAVRMICAPEETDNVTLGRMQCVLMNEYSGLTSYGDRACLLYFHMFPVDNPTQRKSLVRRWLAEELVEKDGHKLSDLDAASEHVKTFVDRNIIQSMQVSSNDTVKSCRLPGTMYEFISRKSISENFVTSSYQQVKPAEPKYVRRLSLHGGPDQYSRCIQDLELYLLRTLAISGKACKKVMDFSQYKIMRVLDLKGCDDELDEKILKAICKLVKLKYLSLPGSIGAVPREIDHLKELETLDLGDTATVKVYAEVINLPGLKHLLGKFRLSTGDKPARHVPNDSRLETLSGFVTNKSGAFAELMIHMKQLRKVKIWCDFIPNKGGYLLGKGDKGEEVEHLSKAIQGFILQGSSETIDVGRSLSIDVKDCTVQFLESIRAKGVTYCRLRKLKLNGKLHKVPEFITGKAIIEQLCLSFTTLCGESALFPSPRKDGASLLSYLRCLKVVEDDIGPLKILPQHFTSLERICLVGKKSIKSITIHAQALQHLLSLHIMCKALDGLAGIRIGGLKMLKEIVLDSEVHQKTKDAWKKAASCHPNKPQVLFIRAAPTI